MSCLLIISGRWNRCSCQQTVEKKTERTNGKNQHHTDIGQARESIFGRENGGKLCNKNEMFIQKNIWLPSDLIKRKKKHKIFQWCNDFI